jgi:hypothetical protein
MRTAIVTANWRGCEGAATPNYNQDTNNVHLLLYVVHEQILATKMRDAI